MLFCVHGQGVVNTLHVRPNVDAAVLVGRGSANRVARLVLLCEPPSIDKGEVTDKGSINQRSVLKHRDPLVHAFHNNLTPNTLLPQ